MLLTKPAYRRDPAAMTLRLRNLAAIMTMLAYLFAGFLVVMPRNAAAAPAQAAAHAAGPAHTMDQGHALAIGHGQHGTGQDHPGHAGDAPQDCAQDCAQGKSCALCHAAVATPATLPVLDGAPAFAAAALRSHLGVTQQLPDEPPSL